MNNDPERALKIAYIKETTPQLFFGLHSWELDIPKEKRTWLRVYFESERGHEEKEWLDKHRRFIIENWDDLVRVKALSKAVAQYYCL